MRRLGAGLALLLAANPARAQVFPGDAPRPPAFPAALSFFLLGTWGGQRATRIYNVGTPDSNDRACDFQANQCETLHRITGAIGIGSRLQLGLTPRTGLRLGLQASRPDRRRQTADGLEVRIPPERLTVIRAEALVLARLKAQVPVFFGAGGVLTRFSPGPTEGQGDVAEYGVALAIGYDRRAGRTTGTRLEWTAYLTKPTVAGLSNEYTAAKLAFDHQLSFAVNLYVGK